LSIAPAECTPASPRDLIQQAIRVWSRKLDTYPGWREWRKGKFADTLHDDDFPRVRDEVRPREFVFSPEIERQHDLVLQYLGIEQAVSALKASEYYFRRYPFRGLPIGKHEHLTYMCEMFFSRFYELKERIKRYLNTLVKLEPGHRIDIGGFLKRFEKEFDQELRERNRVHHHGRFEDLAIDRIFLTRAIAERHDGWAMESDRIYRESTREWAERVRRRSARVDRYVDAIAQTTLDGCRFLKLPAPLRSSDLTGEPLSQ